MCESIYFYIYTVENFVVSARKYRPQQFKDVVGQEHVTDTLKNALIHHQLAHSFLFCGPRGVGKTTCARILARVINCLNPTADFEACDECANCKSFDTSASFNIYELDAASNNSVEDIRSLTEQVRFAPQSGKYKIYIIDEVHMLSSAAFNAFLKTLEEPPSYAIFILATTEKHKILPTILSRCQVFDFKRIGVEKIVEQLEKIAQEEKYEVDRNALLIIAQKADGGLRDALSLFDKMMSFSGNKLTYDDVVKNLNILDFEYFFKCVSSFLQKDIHASFLLFNEILNNGFEGDDFVLGLAEHLRNLFLCKNQKSVDLLELSGELKERYLQQSAQCSIPFLINALRILNECDVQYRLSKNKRLLVEICLSRLCVIEDALLVTETPTTDVGAKKKLAEPHENNLEKKIEEVVTENPPLIEKAVQPDELESINKVAEEPPTKAQDEKKADISPNQTRNPDYNFLDLKQFEQDLGKKLDPPSKEKPIQTHQQISIEKNAFAIVWNDIIKTLEQNDKDAVNGVLLKQCSYEINDNQFNIILPKETHRSMVTEVFETAIEEIRTKLKNPSIIYQIAIEEKDLNQDENWIPYSPKDKLAKMKKEHPAAQIIIDQLGLDLDY